MMQFKTLFSNCIHYHWNELQASVVRPTCASDGYIILIYVHICVTHAFLLLEFKLCYVYMHVVYFTVLLLFVTALVTSLVLSPKIKK